MAGWGKDCKKAPAQMRAEAFQNFRLSPMYMAKRDNYSALKRNDLTAQSLASINFLSAVVVSGLAGNVFAIWCANSQNGFEIS
jgi:hypothetical protein